MKKHLLLVLINLICICAFAQAPVNDEPLNATTVSVVPVGGSPAVLNGTTVNATLTDTPSAPGMPSSCGCTTGATAFPNDVWYTFNSGSFTNFEININSSNYIGAPGYLRVYQNIGALDAPIQCFCSINSSTAVGTAYLNSVSPNTVYYLAVSPKVGTNGFWGPFTINVFGSNTPLEVELLNFLVDGLSGSNKLHWEVTLPNDIKEFRIQRKVEGNSYGTIHIITPNKKDRTYYYEDKFTEKKGVYYRIEFLSEGGEIVYSQEKYVAVKPNTERILLYPNPANESITIEWNTAVSGRLNVFNMYGVQVFTQEITTPNDQLIIPCKDWSSGLYHLEYSSSADNETLRETFMKK